MLNTTCNFKVLNFKSIQVLQVPLKGKMQENYIKGHFSKDKYKCVTWHTFYVEKNKESNTLKWSHFIASTRNFSILLLKEYFFK